MGFGNENETYTYLTPQHLLPPVGYRFTSIDNTNGSLHVVATLAAVPEPSTCVLAALGLLACSSAPGIGGGASVTAAVPEPATGVLLLAEISTLCSRRLSMDL